MEPLHQRLTDYKNQKKLTTKGKLAAILHVTRVAKEQGLPLNPDALVTDGKGQVLGLGKARVQGILKEYGITRVLAEEAGRTSRGSLGLMLEYVDFLNNIYQEGLADINLIETWWVERVKDYFTAQPLSIKFDKSKSLQSVVGDLIQQALKRQKINPGVMYAGTVLQHLVGAKLELIMGVGKVEHHGSSVADAVSNRSGDFVIDDIVIHVTTAPGEALMRKCARNIDAGCKPVIITIYNSMAVAFSLAGIHDMQEKVDIFDAEQFIAANVYEWSKFQSSDQKMTIMTLIDKYNELIEEYETDPSLKVAGD